MRAVKRICAVIVGLVFLVAGLLKLMDPVGTGLIVEEYMKFFHTPFAIPLSKYLGTALALLETILGAGLVTGVWRIHIGIATGVVLVAFTSLTLVLWIVNPAMDCGCFGEAVHLTHFQSLMKNVVLLVLWALAFFLPGAEPESRTVKHVAFFITVFSALAFTVGSYLGIPTLDFTAFKPGAVLFQAGGDADAPILSICDRDGEYCDESLASGPVLVVSAYDYDKLGEKSHERIREAMDAAALSGVPVFMVVSGDIPEEASFSADRRTLMTLNRSNGGATLFRDGHLIAKWPVIKLPTAETLSEILSNDPVEATIKENSPRRLKLQGFLLYVFAVILLL